LADPDPGIRRETAAAIPNLKWIGEKRAAWLVAAFKDRDNSVRGQALDSLWILQDEQAIPALQAAMQDADPLIRAKAAVALTGTAAGKTVLLGMFSAAELDRMGRDYKAVIRAGDETSVPLLVAALFSNKDMDVDILLNAGNNELMRAGKQYAWDQGGYVLPSSGQPGLTWGGG
jgi:HEAT repeat protein